MTGPERIRKAIEQDRGQHAPVLPITLCAGELKPHEVWPDSDADGLRSEVRAQWPQLADALDADVEAHRLQKE